MTPYTAAKNLGRRITDQLPNPGGVRRACYRCKSIGFEYLETGDLAAGIGPETVADLNRRVGWSV
jgi:hypothetical protein